MVADKPEGKLIKIGESRESWAHSRLQIAEVAIPRNLFTEILRMIAEMRPPPAASTA